MPEVLEPYHLSKSFKKDVHVWAKDMEEGKEYTGTSACSHVFKKEGGQVFFRKSWEEEWTPCKPCQHAVMARRDLCKK